MADEELYKQALVWCLEHGAVGARHYEKDKGYTGEKYVYADGCGCCADSAKIPDEIKDIVLEAIE